MSQHKTFLRTVYDAMVESRSRQAAREISYYRESFERNAQKK